MQNGKLKIIALTEVSLLRELAIQTYRETFADSNSEALLQQYFKESLNKDVLSTQLQNPNSEFYFIYEKNTDNEKTRPAGFLKLNIDDAQTDIHDPTALEVEKIYISKRCLGNGLGKQMISFAIQRAQEQHKKHLWLGVWESNFSAIAFYQKMGFEKFGEHPFNMGGDIQTDFLFKKTI